MNNNAAIAHIERALDLIRAFALQPQHPLHAEKMLKAKGLLETALHILEMRKL